MTLFYGTYDDCKVVTWGCADTAEAYEDARKYLQELGTDPKFIRFKTWISPEGITTVEFGGDKEFYIIKRDILPPDDSKVSLRIFERVD